MIILVVTIASLRCSNRHATITRRNADAEKLVISDQRIKGKLAECNFFLEHMEKSRDVEEFGYYLSAFLSALATYTSLGLMRQHGKSADQAHLQLRKNSSDFDLLLRARDVEVHREGVRVWLYRASRSQSRFPRFGGGLWSTLALTTPEQRAKGTPRSRYGGGLRSALQIITRSDAPKDDPGYGFIFEDSGRDVLKSCRSALDAVRSLSG